MRPKGTECGDLMDHKHQKHLLCPLHLLSRSPQPSAGALGDTAPDPTGRASHALIPEGHLGAFQRTLPTRPRGSGLELPNQGCLGVSA